MVVGRLGGEDGVQVREGGGGAGGGHRRESGTWAGGPQRQPRLNFSPMAPRPPFRGRAAQLGLLCWYHTDTVTDPGATDPR